MSLAGPWTLEKRVISACASILAAILVAAVQWGDYDWSLGRTFTLHVVEGAMAFVAVAPICSQIRRWSNMGPCNANTCKLISGGVIAGA